MGRTTAKKAIERRKKPRTVKRVPTPPIAASKEECQECGKALNTQDRALFVEEEIGRMFCTEKCIAAFFATDIERLEKQYFKRLGDDDLTADERENLSHLRWITLQEPDEVWKEKTLSGDSRYTLISEFRPHGKPLWCICICLFLRGEPSFLYLSFVTKERAMVESYQKGERVQWTRAESSENVRKREKKAKQAAAAVGDGDGGGESTEEGSEITGEDSNRLAGPWTEEETFRAQTTQERSADDIPVEDFPQYHELIETTLETPDELWGYSTKGVDSTRIYHFIKHFKDQTPALWYVVIARESEDDEQVEILDAFPSRDSAFVERYRRGDSELDYSSANTAERIVH